MIELELAKTLSEFPGTGYVIAPAGFGKTHLIAMAVNLSASRQLVLTHTFAGVSSITKKMQILGVPTSKYHVDTIASWILRLCLAYPKNSGWDKEAPEKSEWNQLYKAGSILLSKDFVKRIILASYSGVYVDEYQDCSIEQHSLILELAKIIPCRILGDPMQAIFDFGGPAVDWEASIKPNFACLGELTTPWRWKNSGADPIGNWLIDVRRVLEQGKKIDLSGKLPDNVVVKDVDMDILTNPNRLSAFYNLANKNKNDTIVVIFPGAPIFKSKTHQLAQHLSGQYSSIEEVEGIALGQFIEKISKAKTQAQRLEAVIDFAKQCMTSVADVLPAGAKKFEISKITKATKCPELARAANNYLEESSSLHLKAFLECIRNNKETHLYRRDLFYRLMNVLDIHIHSEDQSLKEAAQEFQKEFRFKGRPIRYSKIIGTTLLLKGLEYDHAIIVDAASMSLKHLYVALTRGSKSVTILTTKKQLPI